MVSLGLSVRRSCELLGIGRSSLAYRRAPDRNAELARRLREIAAEQPRLGCRMAWAQLRAEFAPLNLKRVRRIWLGAALGAGTMVIATIAYRLLTKAGHRKAEQLADSMRERIALAIATQGPVVTTSTPEEQATIGQRLGS